MHRGDLSNSCILSGVSSCSDCRWIRKATMSAVMFMRCVSYFEGHDRLLYQNCPDFTTQIIGQYHKNHDHKLCESNQQIRLEHAPSELKKLVEILFFTHDSQEVLQQKACSNALGIAQYNPWTQFAGCPMCLEK